MRIVLLVAALTLTACGSTPDYVSKAGISYWFGNVVWDLEDVEAQEQAYLANLPYDPEWVLDMTAKVSVLVFEEAWACTAQDGFCNGEQVNSSLWVRNMGCPFNSEVDHELGHLLYAATHDGWPDGPHADAAFWALEVKAGECK